MGEELLATLSISSRRSAFAQANEWFENFLGDAKVSEDAASELLLVFEEVVTNVMNHAYREAEGSIGIVAQRSAVALTLTVCDAGPAFDPLELPAVDVDVSTPDRPIGGLGIHLVKSLCDQIRYQRLEDSNILTLTKSLT